MTPQVAKAALNLKSDFDLASCKQPAKKPRMAPLSVRMSKEQRERLRRDAMGMAVNAYVLSRLFDDEKPKSRRKKATKQDKAIASALRRLGLSGISNYLVAQILAVEEGRLHLSKDDEAVLRSAYGEFNSIRRDLVAAMGLESEYGS